MVSQKSKETWEFGDFQTPKTLASQITKLLSNLSLKPKSILEPTCGKGAFILAAATQFPEVRNFVGLEINYSHIQELYKRKEIQKIGQDVKIIHANFFDFNWPEIINQLAEPIFIIGNPPWVTSAELGILQSSNIPKKSNFQERNGLDALTGKSNFDISEWMLLKHLEWLKFRTGVIAMLCKTSVARKVLVYAWKHNYPIQSSRIYRIDAQKHFNAAVDACFLIIEVKPGKTTKDCLFFNSLLDLKPSHSIGYRDETAIFDIALYEKLCSLRGTDEVYTWRSGIKHDCAKVMELERTQQGYKNGNGITFEIEDTYVYPLLKSSDISNHRLSKCRKYVLVTQQYVGEDTSDISTNAPQTWKYLQNNMATFIKRGSSIYKNRPAFSIFGVGEYTFASWKVAISGFYKNLEFQVVGPIQNKPTVFDDTIYFLACESEKEAKFIAMLLNSEPARDFFSSMIFWNDKRPITIELLKRLNIQILASKLGYEEKYLNYVQQRKTHRKHFYKKIYEPNIFEPLTGLVDA